MLSAIVLTHNQKELLQTCLESVKWADEIVIVDDQSDSETLALANQYTNKVLSHPLVNFADQRSWALAQATGDWLLYLDPDERVTKDLREEIKKTITSATHEVAYAIPRRNFFLGKEQKMVGGWPDYVIRLFKKEALQSWHGELHEQPEFKGQLGHLKQPLIHLTHIDITSMTQKTLAWSHLEAKLRLDAHHPTMTSWRFLRILATSFFDWYIKKGGFRGGTEGTIEAMFQTFSIFFAYVRLWELQRNPTLAETYRTIDQKLLESDFASV